MKLYSTLLFISLALLSFQSYATHSYGGNITYTCDLSAPNKIIVKLTLYRDCDGITMGSTEMVSIKSTCISKDTMILNLTAGPLDVTPVCHAFPNTPCPGTPNTNIQVPVGLEEYVYTGSLTLPGNPGCEVTLSYRQQGRPQNIDGPNLGFYIYNTFQIQSTCNNSPQFLASPVPYTCSNQQYLLSTGVADPEGDSLSFCFVDCLDSVAVPLLNYKPLTSGPIKVDQKTGNITFTPSVSQKSLTCVKVEEFRNGVKISESIRDMQLIVTNCMNLTPTVSGINNSTKYDTMICAGQPVSFNINVADPNMFQKLNVYYQGGIPGAGINCTSGTTNINCAFNWAGTNIPGKYIYTLGIIDSGCPLPAVPMRSYLINVAASGVSNHRICPGDSIFLAGAFRKAPGTFTETVAPCNAVIQHVLTVGAPIVTFTGLDTLYCIFDAPVTLTGSPFGGTFSGPGVAGNTFNPVVAGTGIHNIIYKYSDCSGCTGSYSLNTRVDGCLGLDEVSIEKMLKIYPNPADDMITISLPAQFSKYISSVRVWDIQGRLIDELKFDLSGSVDLAVNHYEDGVYILEFNSETLAPVTKRVVVYH